MTDTLMLFIVTFLTNVNYVKFCVTIDSKKNCKNSSFIITRNKKNIVWDEDFWDKKAALSLQTYQNKPLLETYLDNNGKKCCYRQDTDGTVHVTVQ